MLPLERYLSFRADMTSTSNGLCDLFVDSDSKKSLVALEAR